MKWYLFPIGQKIVKSHVLSVSHTAAGGEETLTTPEDAQMSPANFHMSVTVAMVFRDLEIFMKDTHILLQTPKAND